MQTRFYNISDFDNVDTRFAESKRQARTMAAMDSATGRQSVYDVFLSHSTADTKLIKKIRDHLELAHDISVYIDWDEDEGTLRDDIADKVKAAMEMSCSFLVVKTDNADASSWVPWEIGYFDKKDADRIGVLLIENQEFNHQTFHRKEYLKSYEILGPDDVVPFIRNGAKSITESRLNAMDKAFRDNNITVGKTGGLAILNNGSGSSTKFYGSGGID